MTKSQCPMATGGVAGAENTLAVENRNSKAAEDCRSPKPGGEVTPRLDSEEDEGLVRFRSYQREVFEDTTSGIVVLHWSRQIGKSFVLAAWAVCRLLDRPGRLVTVLSNSRENGAEFLHKCAEICALNGTRFATITKPSKKASENAKLDYEDMRLELRIRVGRKVGRIKVLAANPRTARGFSGDLILDEFAFHDDADAIWDAAQPILEANKDFLCRIASTGNGKHNLFYRMVEGAGEHEDSAQIKNEKFKVKNCEERESGKHLPMNLSMQPAIAPSPQPSPPMGARGNVSDALGSVPISEKGSGEKGSVTSEPPHVGCYEKDGNGGPAGDAPASGCSGATSADFYLEEYKGGFRKVYLPPRPKREKTEFKMTYTYEGGPVWRIVYRSAEEIRNERLKVKHSEEENGKHLSPALVPTPGARGEGDDCVVGTPVSPEGAFTAGGSCVAATPISSGQAGPADTGALRGEKSELPDVGCHGKEGGAAARTECDALPAERPYYKSKAGYWVSRVTRTMAHGMGLEIYDSHTREPISPEQARAQAMDKAAYDQNFECKFGDENLALLTHELISAAEWDDVGEICEQDWTASAFERMRQSKGDLFAGLDVGRKVDMSVLTVLERVDGLFWIRGLLRMRDMRLPDQELRLGKLHGLRQLKQVCIDMTGLGLGLFEYAQRKFGEHWISGINFASSVSATRVILSEGFKRESVRVTEALAMEVLRAYEDKKVRQPRDWQLREDLRKPGKVTTPAGRVSIAAVRDGSGHADHFWSLALALEAAGGARAAVPFAWEAIKTTGKGLWG